MEQEKSFFQALFDFSFSSYVTPKIIKFVYALSIAGAGLFLLMMLSAGLLARGMGPAEGLIVLVVAPLAAFLIVLYSRIMLELVMVLFKISEDTHAISDTKKESTPEPRSYGSE